MNPKEQNLKAKFEVDPKGNASLFKRQALATNTISVKSAQQLMTALKEQSFDLAQEAINELPAVVE